MSLICQLNCKVDERTNAAIDRYCDKYEVSKADFIRAAISEYLYQEERIMSDTTCECGRRNEKQSNDSSYCSTAEFEMLLRLIDQQNFMIGKLVSMVDNIENALV